MKDSIGSYVYSSVLPGILLLAKKLLDKWSCLNTAFSDLEAYSSTEEVSLTCTLWTLKILFLSFTDKLFPHTFK